VRVLSRVPKSKPRNEKKAKTDVKKVIQDTMLERIDRILAIALLNGHTHIILGAYGCGVFRNNVHDVAGYFKALLTGKGKFAGHFEQVVFAVVEDRSNRPAAGDAKTAPDAKSSTDTKTPAADPKKLLKPRESKLAVFINTLQGLLTAPPPVISTPDPITAPAAVAAVPVKK